MRLGTYPYKTHSSKTGPKHKFTSSATSSSVLAKSGRRKPVRPATSRSTAHKPIAQTPNIKEDALFTHLLAQNSEENKYLPFQQVLEQFGYDKEKFMGAMGAFGKQAGKNTLKVIEENYHLMQKYQENLKLAHMKEVACSKNLILNKQVEVQKRSEKTQILKEKKEQILNLNREKLEDVEKIQDKIEDAKKELEEILRRKQERNTLIAKKMQVLETIKAKRHQAEEDTKSISAKIDSFTQREQHSYFFYKRYLHNQMQELKGNIRVFCRVRPPLEGVDDSNDIVFDKGIEELMKFPDLQSIEVNADPEDAPSARTKKSNNAMTSQMFKFDAVFDESSDQYDVFREVSELVISALDGYKVCIFAYGQTGSGKTYTMEGDYDSKDHMGIIPRSVEILFENIEKYKENGWDFTVKVNFQEIYLEQIRDLLLPTNSARHMNKYNKYEPTIIQVEKASDVYSLLHKARENRVIGETQSNQHSSRSHSLFQLQISGHHPTLKEGGLDVNGAINLIDLAGSERLHKSKAEGDRLKEAMSINKSLSCLGHVISNLANKDKHIPYRDSKLTYILKDHIGSPSAKTLMIVNISPLAAHVIESVNSLRFASKVNSCIINSRRHE